jgi:hypothetical protein
MDILSLYQDFSVDYRTEGHRHCRPGWINTECPFCTGNPGYHLGYHLETNHYVCWRCGFHAIPPTIAKLLRIKIQDAYTLIKQYGLLYVDRRIDTIKERTAIIHQFPSGVEPLTDRHKQYLEKRGFDPERLERQWYLLSTGPVSLLDHINYKHRILIPFFWNSIQVSFDSRDTTGKHPSKYMACPKSRELIPHKEILYGNQFAWGRTGICVEGPTDVWRFGNNSFATSGIKYTPRQIRLIAKTFKRVPVCFDGGEEQAKIQANALIADLRFRGVDSFRVDIEGDPGSMKQSDADYLVKQLLS